jgi:membrane complex biogenesis BtpA family protein
MLEMLCESWSSVRRPVIGMLHLPPLPGSPRYGGDMAAVSAAVLRDAEALERGGVHGLMLENFGDVPFFSGPASACTISHMTALALAVRQASDLPLGINVLRNDGVGALAIAHAVGGAFIRVNILAGAAVTDQGIIEGCAATLLRRRRELAAESIKVLADVAVKHATSLDSGPIEQQVHDLIDRALADGVIVSGSGTGRAVDVEQLRGVKAAAGDVPVLVGSGATIDSLEQLAIHSDALIVGSHFKVDGRVENPVDQQRVSAFIQRLESLSLGT